MLAVGTCRLSFAVQNLVNFFDWLKFQFLKRSCGAFELTPFKKVVVNSSCMFFSSGRMPEKPEQWKTRRNIKLTETFHFTRA
jgi:hypothetical protein